MKIVTATLSLTMMLAGCAGTTTTVEAPGQTESVEKSVNTETADAPKTEGAENTPQAEAPSYTEFSKIKWTAAGPKGDQGPMMAVIHGSPKTGPVTFIFKLPAGHSAGLHTHPSNFSGAVVSGTIVQGKSAEQNKNLPAGSAWTQNANQAHYTACAKEADCFVVGHFDGPFGTVPAETVFEGENKAISTHADEATFTPLNPKMPKGPHMFVLSGDHTKGPFQALVKLPAGFNAPPHSHAASYAGATISGSMQKNGGAALPAGSFWAQAGNQVHTNACVSETPCIFFVSMDGAFTMTPAPKTEEGANP